MPYIITTKKPAPGADPQGDSLAARSARQGMAQAGESYHPEPRVSRLAVATLDEARRAAHQEVVTRAHQLDDSKSAADGSMPRQAMQLPESGGTVGPLLDGTVIEVEAKTAYEMWVLADRPDSARGEHYMASAAESVAAYNAAQGEQ